MKFSTWMTLTTGLALICFGCATKLPTPQNPLIEMTMPGSKKITGESNQFYIVNTGPDLTVQKTPVKANVQNEQINLKLYCPPHQIKNISIEFNHE